MKNKFKVWRQEHYSCMKNSLGKCSEATLHLINDFPELKRVKGVVLDFHGREHLHWWCVDDSNEIYDPTIKQFGCAIVEYQELPKDDPRCNFTRQKCMNCGIVYYKQRPTFCSDKCVTEFESDN